MAPADLTQPNRPLTCDGRPASQPPAGGQGPQSHVNGRLNPSALPVADAARLLSAAGGQLVTAEMIQADVDAGAPTNTDGTINLVQYAAWLVRDMARRADAQRPLEDINAVIASG
jgi:hypothetical protein